MNEVNLKLNELQVIYELLIAKSISESNVIENTIILKLDDDQTFFISEKLKEELLNIGFDDNYRLNQKGKLIQGIIDKFIDAGW